MSLIQWNSLIRMFILLFLVLCFKLCTDATENLLSLSRFISGTYISVIYLLKRQLFFQFQIYICRQYCLRDTLKISNQVAFHAKNREQLIRGL